MEGWFTVQPGGSQTIDTMEVGQNGLENATHTSRREDLARSDNHYSLSDCTSRHGYVFSPKN